MQNHFHVVSYSLDNRLVGNVVKPTRQAAKDVVTGLRAKYGNGRSVGILPCDNHRHAS